MSDHSDDDDNTISKTLQVFISPTLSKTLTLLQYPLLPKSTSNPLTLKSIRTKPNNKIVEIDVNLPSDDGVIDSETSYKFRDGARKPMDTLTYVSNFIPPSMHYVLGKFDQTGDLHLSELGGGMYMLKMGLSHVDEEEIKRGEREEKEKKEENARNDFVDFGGNKFKNKQNSNSNVKKDSDDDDDDDDSDNDEKSKKDKDKPIEQPIEPALQPIQFKKKESDRAQSARKSSYAYKKESIANESWTHLAIRSKTEADLTNMECQAEFRTDEIIFSGSDYVDGLNYMPPLNSEDTELNIILEAAALGALPGATNSLSSLPTSSHQYYTNKAELGFGVGVEVVDNAPMAKNQLLPIIVKYFFAKNAPINTRVLMNTLKGLSNPPSIQTVITCLQKCAYLIQGNWVLKSKYTAYNTSGKILRDVILLIIQEQGYVERSRLNVINDKANGGLGVRKLVLKDMLTQFCKMIKEEGEAMTADLELVVGRRWVLRLEEDLVFIEGNEKVVEECEKVLEGRRKKVGDFLDGYYNAVV